MRLRILCALLFASCAGQAHADLINGNFTTNFNGWNTSTTTVGAGSWGRSTSGIGLAGPIAKLSLNLPNSTISMFQDFTLSTLVPGQVTSASLTWSQYLETDQTVPHWSDTPPVQQFQVVLSDSSGDSLVAFTTTGASPTVIGPGSQSAPSSDLVSFLNQLSSNETIRLSFQATESDLMAAEIDNVALSFTQTPASVPEPSSLLLAGLIGSGSLAFVRRRRLFATTKA